MKFGNSETQWFPWDFRDLPDLHLCSWDRRVAPRCSSSAAPAEVPQLTTIWRIHEGSMKDPWRIHEGSQIHRSIFRSLKFGDFMRFHETSGAFFVWATVDSVKPVGHVISSVRPGMPPPTVTKDGRLVAPCRHRKRDALEVPCGTNADLRFFFDITGIHRWQKST